MNIKVICKRLMAAILAFSIWGSVLTFAKAEELTATNVPENLEFLNSLGILLFNEEEGFQSNSEMTREEFAMQAALLLNENPETYVGLENPYTDVDQYTEGIGAILLLTHRNIINGYSDKSFGTDKGITTVEATTLICRMLGYERIGGNTLRIKNKLGFSDKRPLTYGDGAELFWQALNAQCVEYTELTGDSTYSLDRTLLEIYFGLEKRVGKVTATPYTSLEETEGTQPGYVKIDNTTYKTDFEMSSLIGCHVEYYAKEASGSDWEIVYAKEKGMKITTISADDLIDFNSPILQYEVKDKTKSVAIPGDVDLIYNGRANPLFSSEQLMPLQGSVTLLEYGGKLETVIVLDILDEIVSSVVDDTIYLRSGKKITPLDYDIEYSLTDTDGEKLDIDKITSGMVLSIIESADQEYIKILASKQTIKGKVTRLSEDKVTIDDAIYELSPYGEENFSSIAVGQQYSFCLNAYNKLMSLRSGGMGEELAYLLFMNDSDSDELMLRVLTYDSRIALLTASDKPILDGKSLSREELCFALKKDGKVNRQLLRIRLDSEGKIKRIDTALNRDSFTGSIEELEKTEGLHVTATGTDLCYKTATKTFQGLAPIDANTVVFFVKPDLTVDINSDNFHSGVSGYLVNDSKYTFTAYSLENKTKAADAIVIYNEPKSAIEETAPLSIVLSRNLTADEDGVAKNSITVLKDKKEISFILDDDIDPDNVKGADSADTSTHSISVGDAIRFAVNNKGKIDLIKMVYDVEDDSANDKGFSYAASTTGSLTDLKYRLMSGYVYDINNGVLSISKKDLTVEENVKNLLVRDIENFQGYSSCTTYLCSRKNGKWDVQISNTSSLLPYTSIIEDCSKVVVTTQYGTPILMVIYQED